MDTIKVYAPNSDERAKLAMAATELTKANTKGVTYNVGDCYFDLGQGWMWTTIIATRSDGQHWQALNPRDHEKIIMSRDIPATVAEIRSDRYWYEG